MINVFVGVDPREMVAYHVLAHSIMKHASYPVSITPIYLPNIGRGIYARERDQQQSTEFAYSRFLVPYLCNYKGRAIFMDCDMLCRADIRELWRMTDDGLPLHVVKHEYTPKTKTKFLGQTQTVYCCKNWSSLMVFNNEKCKDLTPHEVNNRAGMFLHQFFWLDKDDIGEIPVQWNHLVGEYAFDAGAKIVHFTLGGCYFKEYESCDYADEWFSTFNEMCHCEDPSNFR